MHEFSIDEGIPLLFWPDTSDATERIKNFYEQSPFPNYDAFDSPITLREKAKKGIFAQWLDSQIPYKAKILEIGCGTGQLSHFLGLSADRLVLATDICLNSLKLGQKFKIQHQINNVHFMQMNLFRPIFHNQSFDFVVCNGVLHHTGDPPGGFRTITRLLKSGGYIVIGLYNTFGRIVTDIRRLLYKIGGKKLLYLDPRLRINNLSAIQRHSWFKDQYQNPHERAYTYDQILKWFDENEIQFINSIPKAIPFQRITNQEKLFLQASTGSRLERLMTQFGMFFSGGKEGGFFIMIGKKK